MPTFHSTTRLKASSELWDVSIVVRHVIIAGHSSIPSILCKQPSTLAFDVSPPPSFALVLGGSVDDEVASSDDIKASGLAEFVRDCFNEMKEELGISGVSKWYVDEEDDGKPKLLLHCHHRPLKSTPKVTLDRIHLTLNWTTSNSSSHSQSIDGNNNDDSMNPFSGSLYMPLRMMFSGLMDRFMSTQLVTRYPLIFGRWRKKLDEEMQYFSPFLSSLHAIVDASEDGAFKSQCKRYTKKIARQQREYIADKRSMLQCTTIEDEDGNEEDELVWALRRLFINGTPRVLLKKLNNVHDLGAEAIESEVATDLDPHPSSPSFALDMEERTSPSLDWSDFSSDEDMELLTSDAALSAGDPMPIVIDKAWDASAEEEVIPRMLVDPFGVLDAKEELDAVWGEDEWICDEDSDDLMLGADVPEGDDSSDLELAEDETGMDRMLWED